MREKEEAARRKCHDARSAELTHLQVSDKVIVQDIVTKKWNKPAEVVSVRESGRSYELKDMNGRYFIRNRKFLRRAVIGQDEESDIDTGSRPQSTPEVKNEEAQAPALRRSPRLAAKHSQPATPTSSRTQITLKVSSNNCNNSRTWAQVAASPIVPTAASTAQNQGHRSAPQFTPTPPRRSTPSRGDSTLSSSTARRCRRLVSYCWEQSQRPGSWSACGGGCGTGPSSAMSEPRPSLGTPQPHGDSTSPFPCRSRCRGWRSPDPPRTHHRHRTTRTSRADRERAQGHQRGLRDRRDHPEPGADPGANSEGHHWGRSAEERER